LRRGPRALINPPLRLRTLSDRPVLLLRPLWVLVVLFATATVILGTTQALRDTYEVRPQFAAFGLDYDVQTDGLVTVERLRRGPQAENADTKWRITAIGGLPVDAGTRASEIARRLKAAEGPSVEIDMVSPGGKTVSLRQKREVVPQTAEARERRDVRIAARLASGLLACGVLLICSVLLVRRRPHDPVALLFAFAFAGMAATIDPPLAMWMAMGWPPAYDIISALWFYLLLIALAVFPDGIFAPKAFRWLVPLGVALALFVSMPQVPPLVQAIVGISALLAILLCQVIRYRRLREGIERQQIKWAAFGFAVGLLLVLAAFVLLLSVPTDRSAQNAWLNLGIVLLFSFGMAAIPFGLLIALTRFRLWEADTVITRSAAYALVTLVVGVVWAASTDLVKLVVEQIVGRESQAGATTAGAVVAAAIFSPTQSLVLGWTRKRFGSPVDRIQDAATRLKAWGLTETPAEVATRALSIIEQVIHPDASAVVIDTAMGPDLVAARGAASEDDPKLVERLTLADEDGSVGTLLLGRRSDGNRYNRLELEAVRQMVPPLADALRAARSRYSREALMQQRLDEMAARLAQLEGRGPNPDPA
jgi:hypothetical protein